MKLRGNCVKVRSVQGFVMRHISEADKKAYLTQPELGFVELEDGSLQKMAYQGDRENSPATITSADMRMNVGECGEPKPMHLRRDGYVDPIESAREKIRVWKQIGDVVESITRHVPVEALA